MENNAPNQGLPLVFMYEGIIYSKELDGNFHKFDATNPRTAINSLGCITVAQAREIFTTAKFISSIIILTNNVNLKL